MFSFPVSILLHNWILFQVYIACDDPSALALISNCLIRVKMEGGVPSEIKKKHRVGLVNFVLVLLDFWRALIGLMLWH